jgi:hypothetical protein
MALGGAAPSFLGNALPAHHHQEPIMANESLSLMEFLRNLLFDRGLQQQFVANPQQTLAQAHLSNLSPADVHDALVLLQDNDTHDFGSHSSHSSHSNQGDHTWNPPAPVPAHHSGSEHQAAVEYLSNHVTNTYVDGRSTNIDNSISQHIDTHGGDVDQSFDNHQVVASGDGAVAAGGNIEHSTITTGDHNQVGNGNVAGDNNIAGRGNEVVHGDGNTTAFGSGAANSSSFDHVNVSDGGAVSVGGAAAGTQTTHDSHDITKVSTDTHTNYDHSFTNEVDTTTDSHNDTHTDQSTDSHDNNHVDFGSHNVDIVH